MTLTIDGTATFTNARGTLIVSRFSMVDDRVEFRDRSGPAACVGETGQYRLRVAVDTLFFSIIQDECQGRRNALGTPWFRVSGALVLTHATLIDGTGAPPATGMTIITDRGLVVSVGRDGATPIPADADVRDMSGMWVMPGLIDGHVHLATNPSMQDKRDRVERRLANALRGGVVGVRDMAGDARALASLARDAAVGDIVSPVIRYSAMFAGPAFFTDPRVRTSSAAIQVGTAPWARAITDTTDLRQAIAEARGTGATGIKMYGELSGALAARIGAEAQRQGMLVWAHLAVFPARPSDIVMSGAHVVSHAPLMSWEVGDSMPGVGQRGQYDLRVTADHPSIKRVLQTMRERNMILEPTLWVFRADPTLPDTSFARRRAKLAADFTRAARAAGVRISAGTDGLGGEDPGAMPNIHEEMALLVEQAGLTPMQALVAATRTAADAAGLGATHGMIVAGKSADFLVLEADPTEDIRNTTRIGFVVQRGKVVQR